MQLNKAYLDKERTQGDLVADRLIETVFSKGAHASLYELLKLPEEAISEQPKSPVKTFLTTKRRNPLWYNSKRISRGQQLFHQYALEIMTLLGAMALPYCYAASPGNKALYLSEKMRKAPGKRLMDTASFVIAVLTPGNLDPQKTGYIYINKVRLIHALSRYFLRQHAAWDMAWGVPINQEDMAGTNLAFSYVILMGLQQSGFSLTQKEREDFIFTWRYIGYLLHIDDKLLPASFTEAARLTHVIKQRNFRKTEEGIILTSELLTYYKSNIPSWQADLVHSQVRHHLGAEVAEYIGLAGDPIRNGIVSFLSEFQSLKNMLTIQNGSYHKMLSQHLMFRQKLN